MGQKVHPTCCQTMRNLLLMLVSCSDRGQGLFSSREKAKSLIIYTATLDHPLNFSWVYLQSVHFQPGWVSPNSVSIYKACSLRVRSSTDPALDSQWCEGLEVERAEQSRHGRSICAVIRTLALTLAFSLFLEHQTIWLPTNLQVQKGLMGDFGFFLQV